MDDFYEYANQMKESYSDCTKDIEKVVNRVNNTINAADKAEKEYGIEMWWMLIEQAKNDIEIIVEKRKCKCEE